MLDDTYRIIRLIGEGGMGVVYEATHARLAGRYAVKVLLQKLSDDSRALARFDREARITSSLQHPNIVQVIDFNRAADGTEYLVMEFLGGQSLADRLYQEGAQPMPIAVGIVTQVAAALAAAHSHGVVHRDLKPDNIFLVPVEGRPFDQVKVLDFGISKVRDVGRGAEEPNSAFALMGTPQYMSPEQCTGRTAEVDAATDQFALAVITYEMLTGRVPFAGDDVAAVLSGVLYKDAPPMDIAPDVERVVNRGLAKSKRDRFPSVTAFANALRAAATEGDADAGGEVFVPTAEETERHMTGPTTLPIGVIEGVNRNAGGTSTRQRGWGVVLLAVAAVAVMAYYSTKRNPGRWIWNHAVATPSGGVTDIRPIDPGATLAAPTAPDPTPQPAPVPATSPDTTPQVARSSAPEVHRGALARAVRRSAAPLSTRTRDLPRRAPLPSSVDADATMPLNENVGSSPR